MLGEDAELQPEQEQVALCLFADPSRGSGEIQADGGVFEVQSSRV